MNPYLEMAAFIGFIAGGTMVFVGQPAAPLLLIPSFAVLTISWIKDVRLAPSKMAWLGKRAVLAGGVLLARRMKNGHWF